MRSAAIPQVWIVDNQSASKKIMQNEDIIAENKTAINKMYGEAHKIAAANNKSIEHRGDFTYSNYANWADIFNEQQWEQLHVAEENIRTAQSNIDSIGEQIEDNNYIIQQYEKAEGAFYDNKYSLSQGYASSIDDLDRAALVFYNTYNVTVEKISSDYDVRVLSQRLAAEQRRIESGNGK